MELDPHKPWMFREFHHFNQAAILGGPGNAKSLLLKGFSVVVVELVSMTMAFDDPVFAVHGVRT